MAREGRLSADCVEKLQKEISWAIFCLSRARRRIIDSIGSLGLNHYCATSTSSRPISTFSTISARCRLAWRSSERLLTETSAASHHPRWYRSSSPTQTSPEFASVPRSRRASLACLCCTSRLNRSWIMPKATTQPAGKPRVLKGSAGSRSIRNWMSR